MKDAPACVNGQGHFWRIDSPNGDPYLTGRCKRCGAERHDFPASLYLEQKYNGRIAIEPNQPLVVYSGKLR